MENLLNLELELANIKCLDKVLFIDYSKTSDNTIIQERLELDEKLYCDIYDNFLKEVPVFISDKHKQIMKYINFVKINKDKDINKKLLDDYFSIDSNVLIFFNYIRTRKEKILLDKNKWVVKK